MSSPASNKINRIFSRLRSSSYSGDLRNQHFSVAIRNNMVISPVMCNYNRVYVFGKKRGTIHAEMNSLNYILNNDKSTTSHINHRLVDQRYLYGNSLQCKGIR
jgi:hypothetical protein